jgi:hypothetical protein
MRNEVLCIFKEERNILHTVHRRKANWICYNPQKNSLLEQVIEGKIGGRVEVTGRRERRYKLLLDDLEENRGFRKL